MNPYENLYNALLKVAGAPAEAVKAMRQNKRWQAMPASAQNQVPNYFKWLGHLNNVNKKTKRNPEKIVNYMKSRYPNNYKK